MQKGLLMVLGALTFICEIVLWIGIGRVVWRQVLPVNKTLALVLGVLATIVVIVIWSFILAPKSDYRLNVYARIIVISAASIVTGYLLYRGHDKTFGIIMMFPVTIIQALGQYLMKDM